MLFKCWRYEIPLTQALNLQGKKVTTRKGLVVQVEQDDRIAFGEIAPLEGFSCENLKQSEIQAIQLLHNWQKTGQLTFSIDLERNFPAVAFGLSCVKEELKGNFDFKPNFQTAGFITNQDLQDLENLQLEQFSTVKIKITAQNLEYQATPIFALCEKFPNIKLRFDANQSLSLAEALKFAENLPAKILPNIEFIEEPCQNWNQSTEFAQITKLPIAIDESLRDFDFHIPENSNAVVIKPSLTGSLEFCTQIIAKAKKNNQKVVLSSSYESSLGIYNIAKLAQIQKLTNPQGLGTLDIFSVDLVHSLNNKPAVLPQNSPFCREIYAFR